VNHLSVDYEDLIQKIKNFPKSTSTYSEIVSIKTLVQQILKINDCEETDKIVETLFQLDSSISDHLPMIGYVKNRNGLLYHITVC
jgi:hypothetical protein